MLTTKIFKFSVILLCLGMAVQDGFAVPQASIIVSESGERIKTGFMNTLKAWFSKPKNRVIAATVGIGAPVALFITVIIARKLMKKNEVDGHQGDGHLPDDDGEVADPLKPAGGDNLTDEQPQQELPLVLDKIQREQASPKERLRSLAIGQSWSEIDKLASNEQQWQAAKGVIGKWIDEAFKELDFSKPGAVKELANEVRGIAKEINRSPGENKLQEFIIEQAKPQVQAAIEKGLARIAWENRMCQAGGVNAYDGFNDLKRIADLTPPDKVCSAMSARILNEAIAPLLSPILEEAKTGIQASLSADGQFSSCVAAMQNVENIYGAVGEAAKYSDLDGLSPADILFAEMDNAPCFAQFTPEARRFKALADPAFDSKWFNRYSPPFVRQWEYTKTWLKQMIVTKQSFAEISQLHEDSDCLGMYLLSDLVGLQEGKCFDVIGKSWETLDHECQDALTSFYKSVDEPSVKHLERICGRKLPRPPAIV